MKKNTRETLLTILYILLGIGAAVLAGYWVIGRPFFRHGSILVRFLVVGFSGSLVYAAARLRGLGYCVMMIVLMFLGQVALDPPLRAESAIIAALWALPVGIAFTASGFTFKSLERIPIGKFIIMALFVGLGYGIGMVAFLTKAHAALHLAPVLRQTVAGLKVGALMGLGMEIVDLVGKALKGQD